jgi:D-inositol-3-phosphate glycosyltransferase
MNKCKAVGITDVVRFVGAVSHDTVWTLYAEAAFMVHIPLDEPFGLVPLEAALMKKTCIVSDHGGPAYTVDNGVTGFHVDALDPENVAQKMEYLLTNSDRALAMGAAAYKKVIENMSWDVFVDNYENHLKQVCGTRQFCR